MARSKKVKKSKQKYRNWVFTLNNYTKEDIERFASPYEQVKCIAYGKEVAPITSTTHLQGFIVCGEPQMMSCFIRQIPRAHIEPMRGRLQDNVKYIQKEGDYTKWGQGRDQGRRTDIVGVKRSKAQTNGRASSDGLSNRRRRIYPNSSQIE